MLWVAVTQLLLSVADMVCLICRSCGVHKQCAESMACWSELCCEFVLLLNVADILYVEGCGRSVVSALFDYLVGVNRLMCM